MRTRESGPKEPNMLDFFNSSRGGGLIAKLPETFLMRVWRRDMRWVDYITSRHDRARRVTVSEKKSEAEQAATE